MRASVVMVVRGEPIERLRRALDSVAVQEGMDGITVCLAAPPEDHDLLVSALRPGGAVESVVLVDNPGGGRSAGLNRAVVAAPDDVVIRVDARTEIPPGYVAACARRLDDASVGLVGGVQWPTARACTGPTGEAIARALRNHWLLGSPAYRRPGAGGPVDTVYLGAFRRSEMLALGGYDEGLEANEDFDLAQRYVAAGQVVWLEPDLVVQYEPRAEWAAVAHQYFAFGRAKVEFWRRSDRRPNDRQRLALAAAGVGLGLALWASRRPRRLASLGLGALGVVAALDHAADPHEPDLGVRMRAWTASTVIIASWLGGITTGVLHRRHR